MDQDVLSRLAYMLTNSRRAVFFGGAGVSTASNIPDCRSAGGLYQEKGAYPPEVILSHTFFERHPLEFFRFYREKMLYPNARPNAAHLALASLERAGILSGVITQNIDNLHQAAGSRHVVELHGSTHRNFCTRCGKSFLLEEILQSREVPRCGCGGIIKPDVVLYEEALPAPAIQEALSLIEQADLLMIGGTSLSVYPAAGFVQDYPGPLVLINRSQTPLDRRADLLIADPIDQVFSAVLPRMNPPLTL